MTDKTPSPDLAAAAEHFAPPKTIAIGKLDMSTPLHGEDPDPLMVSFSDKVLTMEERRELEWLRDLYSRFAAGTAPRKFSRIVGMRFAPVQALENKLDIRGSDPEKVAAVLTTPIAAETRLKGTDVTINIFKDGVLQDDCQMIKDCTITVADKVMVEFTGRGSPETP
jgi:hypothetical protein